MHPAAAIDDERLIMARSAGALWLIAAFVALGGLLIPGAERDNATVLVALFVPVGLHGISCLIGVPWTRASITVHALSTVAMLPLVAVALWATGDADSYLRPLLPLAACFVGYFYPRPWRVVLIAELVLVASTPLLLDPAGALDHNFLRWWLAFTATVIGMSIGISQLKQRLVRAERHQRDMAHRDPLTGVANRRAFDAALEHAAASGRPFLLLVIDLDDFKGINDTWGHPAGDRVLKEIAARCADVVREGDCLARIGGDEFAIVAPGARKSGAQRMADAVAEAVACVRRGEGDGPMRATVAPAAFPDDGATVPELLKAADGTLHALKRAQRPAAKSV